MDYDGLCSRHIVNVSQPLHVYAAVVAQICHGLVIARISRCTCIYVPPPSYGCSVVAGLRTAVARVVFAAYEKTGNRSMPIPRFSI